MLCTYCKTARVENEAPCPNCGAPSPLLGQAQQGSWGTGGPGGAMPWGNPGTPGTSFGAQWEQQQVPQMSFDNNATISNWQHPSGQLNNAAPPNWHPTTGQLNNGPANNWQPATGQLNPMPSWQQPSDQLNPMPSWQQPSDQLNPMPSWQQPSGQLGFPDPTQDVADHSANQALLPVPYQGGMELEPAGRQSTISLQLVPEHAIQHLLPAEPLVPDTVHIQPMYTKERPLIPKRRAISGLISVIIVALLLCTGAGYYAKASGTWDNVTTFLAGGEKPVSNIQSASVKIPDPPSPSRVAGPAQSNVPSISLATRINNSYQPVVEQNIFQPGQQFYLTFTAQPTQKTTGTVTVKWYQNNIFYLPQQTPPIKYDPANISNYKMPMRYDQPASGKVEIYWQNKLAWTLYFAVR